MSYLLPQQFNPYRPLERICGDIQRVMNNINTYAKYIQGFSNGNIRLTKDDLVLYKKLLAEKLNLLNNHISKLENEEKRLNLHLVFDRNIYAKYRNITINIIIKLNDIILRIDLGMPIPNIINLEPIPKIELQDKQQQQQQQTYVEVLPTNSIFSDVANYIEHKLSPEEKNEYDYIKSNIPENISDFE